MAFTQEEKDRLLKEYKSAVEIAKDYCAPYFDKFLRFSNLFQGNPPPELDGTHSKVFLALPYAMIENELPRSTRAFGTSDWFSLRAREPELEIPKSTAQKWLKYQMEYVQNFATTIVPTIQATHVFGTGYRVYSHRYVTKVRSEFQEVTEMGIPIGLKENDIISKKCVISGQFTNVFNVLPLPGGGIVNPVDDTAECAVDAVIWVDYMTEQSIKQSALDGIFDEEEVGKMLESGARACHPAESYLQSVASSANAWNGFAAPSWIRDIRAKNRDLTQRYMVAWYFKRDRWVCVGEDNYLLYVGEPAIDAIPIAKFTAGFDMGNWFGKGLIELSEDLLISINLNLNMRLDWLAGMMHPPTYIPEDLVDFNDGDMSIFDPTPYSKIKYPRSIMDIQRAIYHDRLPEISQQTFIDEDRMNRMMEKVVGQADLLKGLSSGGNAEGTAMGMSVLASEGTARSMMRAANIEGTGVRDSIWLTLKYGAKYKNQEEWIMEPTANGLPWSRVESWMLQDGYAIEVTGNRNLQAQEDTIRKMLSVAQLMINNPAVPNQRAVIKPLAEKAGWENVDEILGPEQALPLPAQGTPPAPADMQQLGGASTLANDMQAMAANSPEEFIPMEGME